MSNVQISLPSSMRHLLTDCPAESEDPIVDAHRVLQWANRRFGKDLVVTASFGDAVLAHVASEAIPGVEIVLLDTGYLFAETEWYAHELRTRFGLNLRVVRPAPDLPTNVWTTDTDACCAARKVEPLNRALAGRAAWVSGLRRSDSDSRRTAPFVHEDLLKNIIKVNPLAGWTDAHVVTYVAAYGLPDHPLTERGYPSIGCWPCTKPVVEGQDPRSGRWSDSDKTECGLHL
ncbi:MAG: phosphoadenylyl-sulfate reductase [Ilumatobacteraceae bacterium]